MTTTDTSSADDVLGRVGAKVRDTLHGVIGPASTAAVFSEPTPVGDDLVFTAAAWERGGGFGFGAGQGSDPEKGSGSGGGGGGGGGSVGRPVALIRIGPDRTEVKPVLDFTKLGMTLLVSVLAAWKAFRR
jgi:uncharacterized spore protein YtfJ